MGSSSSGRANACPAQGMGDGRAKQALQLEFLFMLLSRKKKKFWSNFGFPLLQVRTVDPFPGWSFLDFSPPSYKALLPKTLQYGPVLHPQLASACVQATQSLGLSLADCIFITLPFTPQAYFCLFLRPFRLCCGFWWFPLCLIILVKLDSK